jgi:hypothetical protein
MFSRILSCVLGGALRNITYPKEKKKKKNPFKEMLTVENGAEMKSNNYHSYLEQCLFKMVNE